MPMPCTVCAHPKRADIDQLLAHQVVNVKRLAESFGLKRDAVARHRAKHLPDFLPALTARAETLTLDIVQAEAQRLYFIALDALARAEAGTLVSVGDDGTATYSVSSTAVARLLREARSALDTLAKLAVVGADPGGTSRPEPNQLDERIAAALERATRTHTPVLDVVEAELVAAEGSVEAGGQPTRGAVAAGGRDLVRADGGGTSRNELPLESAAPTGGSRGVCPRTHKACDRECRAVCQLDAVTALSEKASLTLTAAEADERTWEWIRDTAKSRGDVLPQHASREELKQMGYDFDRARKLIMEQERDAPRPRP